MKILSTLSPDKKRRIPAIDRSFLEPIGELTVNFAMLEQAVAHGIWHLVSDDQYLGTILTSELSFRRKVETLSCLHLYRYPGADPSVFKALAAKLYQLEEKRNTFIHSYWGRDPKSSEIARMKTTAKAKGLSSQLEIVSRETIVEIALRMAEVARELEIFYNSFT